MRYESAKTAQGNVGVSYESQALADAQALAMDEAGNKNCTRCTDCTDCRYCPSQPLQLTGLRWNVTIRKEPSVQIGCQDHPTQFWRDASDSEIAAMAPQALAFWHEHKERILALAESYQVET